MGECTLINSLIPNLRLCFNFYIPLLWVRESVSNQHLITSPSSLSLEQPDLCWLQPTPARPDLHSTARLHKRTAGLKTYSCTKGLSRGQQIASGLCKERVMTQHRPWHLCRGGQFMENKLKAAAASSYWSASPFSSHLYMFLPCSLLGPFPKVNEFIEKHCYSKVKVIP